MLADADELELSLAASVVLYYQACLSSMDAILTAAGRRITSGVDAHRVRIEEVGRVLGHGYGDLMERMDEWRRERADVSYAAVEPSASTVAALQADAHDMVGAAETFLAKHG